MAALIVIAKNQTASPVYLAQFNLTVPGSGQLELTTVLTTSEIYGDKQLQDLVDQNTLVLNDGTNDLPASALSVGHGTQPGGSTHAAATGSTAGFMSAADKTKADAYPATPAGIDHNSLTNLGTGDPHTQYQNKSEKGVANGYASLGPDGRVPSSQLSSSAFENKGNWDANTNTPTLTSGVGTNGDLYRVSVAGSTNLDGETDWEVGDNVVFNGTAWEKWDNTSSVTSVNGQQGAVVLTATDVGGDAAGTPRPPTAHAVDHIQGGSDEVDGDRIDIDFSPTNYTPDTSPPEVSDVDHLSAHLKGIDDALAGIISAGGEFFSAYDSAGGTAIGVTNTPIPLGARYIITSAFTHTLGMPEVTINEDGVYLVIAHAGIEKTTGTARSSSEAWLELDTGSGFVPIVGTFAYGYHRNSANSEDTSATGLYLNLAAGDRLRLVGRLLSGSGPLATIAGGSRLLIGSTVGPQGPTGPTGAGSNVIVKDNGVVVPGGPHSSLDFQGAQVSVVDAGSGEATITVQGSVFGQDYQFVKGPATQTVSNTNPLLPTSQAVSLVVPALTGTYMIEWSAELSVDSTVTDGAARLYNQTDGVVITPPQRNEPQDALNEWRVGDFDEVVMTGTPKEFRIQFWVADASGGDVTIKDPKIKWHRVS